MIKGLLNIFAFICLIGTGISVIMLVDLLVRKIKGEKEVVSKTDKNGKILQTMPINETIKYSIIVLVICSILMFFSYGFANDWHTPSEVSEIAAEKQAIEKQKKAEEKALKEQKKAEEKAEKERKQKEEMEAQEQKKRERAAKAAQEKIDKENADKNNHDYVEVNINTLLGDLESNAARAKKNYDGKYVKIVGGVVKNIESDGDYISIDAPSGIGLRAVQCIPKYQSTREQIFNLNNEQYLTVYGKITHVGEVVGYSLDLLKIE